MRASLVPACPHYVWASAVFPQVKTQGWRKIRTMAFLARQYPRGCETLLLLVRAHRRGIVLVCRVSWREGDSGGVLPLGSIATSVKCSSGSAVPPTCHRTGWKAPASAPTPNVRGCGGFPLGRDVLHRTPSKVGSRPALAPARTRGGSCVFACSLAVRPIPPDPCPPGKQRDTVGGIPRTPVPPAEPSLI